MNQTDQRLPEREELLSALADINVALCRSSNSPRHWQANNVMGKVAEVLTSPEFDGLDQEDEDTWMVRMRRFQSGSYVILTTKRPTALEALVAVYDEMQEVARR